MTHRAFRGVVHNFLGAFTSRYSEYDGYWLFGWVVDEIEHMQIDLLNLRKPATESLPMVTAVQLAVRSFAEQVRKAGLAISCLQEAFLTIQKSPSSIVGTVNGHERTGHEVSFTVSILSHRGKKFERETTLFVAPHDTHMELQSTQKDA